MQRLVENVVNHGFSFGEGIEKVRYRASRNAQIEHIRWSAPKEEGQRAQSSKQWREVLPHPLVRGRVGAGEYGSAVSAVTEGSLPVGLQEFYTNEEETNQQHQPLVLHDRQLVNCGVVVTQSEGVILDLLASHVKGATLDPGDALVQRADGDDGMPHRGLVPAELHDEVRPEVRVGGAGQVRPDHFAKEVQRPALLPVDAREHALGPEQPGLIQCGGLGRVHVAIACTAGTGAPYTLGLGLVTLDFSDPAPVVVIVRKECKPCCMEKGVYESMRVAYLQVIQPVLVLRLPLRAIL